MNRFAVNRRPSNPDCADSMSLAERELGAFFRAVTELFGPELAELSAKEWLGELEAMDDLPTSTREWRLLTTNVAARLAHQMKVSSPLIQFATT